MGDLVAAVDAAAHAAIAYRRQDLRGSALGCARHAQTRWPTTAAASLLLRFVRPASRCR